MLGGVSSSSSFTTMMRPTAKERRVHFQQETKSQSLDTPYHHTHEQQKLDMEMDSDTMAERSKSFTAISQCYTSDKGKENSKFYYLLPYVLLLLVLHCLDCIEYFPDFSSTYLPSFRFIKGPFTPRERERESQGIAFPQFNLSLALVSPIFFIFTQFSRKF